MNSITFFLSFIPILTLILLAINLIFAPHNPYQEKSSTFECGFHSFLGQNRTQFNISFFVFGLIFLVFDLELVISLPAVIDIYDIEEYGIAIMIMFFAILTVGFAFEIGKNALNIDSRQYNSTLYSYIGLGTILRLKKQQNEILEKGYLQEASKEDLRDMVWDREKDGINFNRALIAKNAEENLRNR